MRADAVPEARLAPRELIKAFGVEAERRGDDLPTGRAERWLIRGNSAYQDSQWIDDFISRMNVRFAAGFEEVARWRDGWYRVVWVSEGLRCIVTYCEGDMTIELADTEDGYQALINYAEQFYRR